MWEASGQAGAACCHEGVTSLAELSPPARGGVLRDAHLAGAARGGVGSGLSSGTELHVLCHLASSPRGRVAPASELPVVKTPALQHPHSVVIATPSTLRGRVQSEASTRI